MGGGVSLMEGVEELMTATILIGKAISSCSMPGMYRIYDFHSSKAPKLKNARQINFFAPDDEDDEEDEQPPPDPADYEHFYRLKIGDDVVYLEDPLHENESGWTALHTLCMSLSTVNAGLDLIDEVLRRGGSLNVKTKQGPGTFNAGWTPLQMACAYGVEPLVEKLVQVGADVNTINSFGYSPLLEACHRGYIVVAKYLMMGPVDYSYIPSEEDAANSPFSGAPCQSALAEAARCGFFKVVQLLLENGAPKDLANDLGWTALHEACFYNRMETVKTLLLNGADATLRTKQNALPYHLASILEIRNMLESMGGPGAAPASEEDKVDMMRILTELTMPAAFRNMSAAEMSKMLGDGDGDGKDQAGDDDECDDDDDSGNRGSRRETAAAAPLKIESKTMSEIVIEPKSTRDSAEAKGTIPVSARGPGSVADAKAAAAAAAVPVAGKISQDEGEGGGNPLLHSGPMLGNLPSLGVAGSSNPASTQKSSPLKGSFNQSELDAALSYGSGRNQHGGGIFGNTGSPTQQSTCGAGTDGPSRRADDKSKQVGKKKRGPYREKVPKDMPSRFICQLTQRPMSDPVQTRYGNIYDRTAIVNWLSSQGKICPLTGAPLSEVDLSPLPELSTEIKQWILKRSLEQNNNSSSSEDADVPNTAGEGGRGRGGGGGGTRGTGGSRDHNEDGKESDYRGIKVNATPKQAAGLGAGAADDDLYDF